MANPPDKEEFKGWLWVAQQMERQERWGLIRSFLKVIAFTLAIIFGIGFGGVYLVKRTYGTLHPCGMLRVELRQSLVKTVGKRRAEAILAQTQDGIIDEIVERRTPSQCGADVIDIRFGDREPFKYVDGRLGGKRRGKGNPAATKGSKRP